MTPVQIATFCYALGVTLGWAIEIPPIWCLPLIFAGLCLLIVPTTIRLPKYFLIFISVGVLMISIFQTGVIDTGKFQDNQYLVTGNIIGIEELTKERSVFDLHVSKSAPPDLSGKIRIYAPSIKNLEISDQVTIKGKPYSAKEARNPGQFDFTQYLSTHGFATLFFASNEPEFLEKSGNLLMYLGPKIRNLSFEVFAEAVPERYALMMDSLVYGRSNIPEDMLITFQKSGTMHILAASGFNVTIMAYSALILLMWVTGHRKASIIGAILISLLYASAAGFSPTVARAVIMSILAMSSGLFSRKYSAGSGLAFAVLALLVFNPNWLFDIGFQLSFASTLGFFVISPVISSRLGNKYWNKKILFIVIQTIVIQLLTLPILAHHFYGFSAVSPISNLIAIPLAEIIVPMGVLAGFIGILIRPVGIMISWIIWPMLVLMDKSIAFLSSFSWTMLITGQLPLLTWIPYYLSIFGFYISIVKPKSIKIPKIKTVALFCAVAFASFSIGTFAGFTTNRTPMVVFLDVGHGDAIFAVTTSGKTILVDCAGPKYSNAFNPGRNIVAPFLKSQGISRLDYVIATHNDSDHIGGFPAVFSEIGFDKIFVSKIKNDTFQNIDLDRIITSNSKSITPSPGDKIQIDNDTVIEFLGPIDVELGQSESQRINNGSICCKLYIKGVSFLLAGDIQNEAMEHHLSNKFNVKSDVVKLPHHGGYSKSLEDWLRIISPKIAVNSDSASEGTGADLRTDETLRKMQIPVISTAEKGAIIFYIDIHGYHINTFIH
jgi:competence protein ComEC